MLHAAALALLLAGEAAAQDGENRIDNIEEIDVRAKSAEQAPACAHAPCLTARRAACVRRSSAGLDVFISCLVCASNFLAASSSPAISNLSSSVGMQVRVQRVAVSPAVFLIEGFLDESMCDTISDAARPRLTPDEKSEGDHRSSMLFSRTDMADINALSTATRRLRSLTRDIINDQKDMPDAKAFLKVYPVETDYAEVPEVVQYGAGGYRRAHNEAFQRDYVLTSLVFLEDTPLGGETAFPDLGFDSKIKQYAPSKFLSNDKKCEERDDELCEQGQYVGVDHAAEGLEFCCCSEILRIKPKKGDAIVFFNTDASGVASHAASHASCPVLEAEGVDETANSKLVLRQWTHAEPLGEQSERALKPDAGEPSVEHDGAGVPFAEKRGGEGEGDKFMRTKAQQGEAGDGGGGSGKKGKGSGRKKRSQNEPYAAKGEKTDL